ncbi:MAG: phage holin family protein [Anaerolineales bacterium]|nr:phage holin family protein [Anaerolineales bacterium]
MRLILRILINIVAVGIAVWILPDDVFSVSGGIWVWLMIAVIIGLVNAFIGPIIKLISLPITCLTLGLFTLVINAFLLLISVWFANLLVPGSVALQGSNWFMTFVWAMVAALIISIVSGVLSWFLPDEKR